MSVEPGRTVETGGRGTVLLAEDDPAVRGFVQTVLEHAGYAVVPADDGLVAGALFAADPARFAVVLTDVLMPKATGPELAARVRQVRPGVPVVFMSAYNDGLAPDEVIVPKPFTVLQLLGALDIVLADGDGRH